MADDSVINKDSLLKNIMSVITLLFQLGAVIWGASTLSSKVTHLDETVHTLNNSMIQVLQKQGEFEVNQAVTDIRLKDLENAKKRP